MIQLGSEGFWTGDDWSPDIDHAKLFRDHQHARRECLSIQRERYKGLPARTFRVEASVTLVAPNVEQINTEQLKGFLTDTVRLDAESDGPVGGSYVNVRLRLGTLEETNER